MLQVQAGDLTRQAPLTGQDPDADQLATSFNTMLAAIDELSKSRATQILHAQEQERKRIARELHDETSQVLTSLLISLELLEESVQTDEARKRVADIRALAHQTLRAVRNLSIDLRPSALDDLGLLPALRWYIKEYQQKCGVEVEFVASGFRERLPAEMETAIYRIMQESLTNTAKHAHAKHVWIALEEQGHAVHARIRDDGQGFDAPAVLRTPWQDRGLGLAGMMERASLLDGTVEIISRAGRRRHHRYDASLGSQDTLDGRPDERQPAPGRYPYREAEHMTHPTTHPTHESATETKSAATTTEATRQETGKIRVLIVDDHTILRAGLRMMLNAQPDIEVVGEASDGHQAVIAAQRLQPDVILMDITMPECNGIEATRQVKRLLPDMRVLVLTMHENEEYLFQVLRAGASGYILKEAADTELVIAIRLVYSGRFYLSPSAQSMMVGDYLQRVHTGEEHDSYSALTEREREILKLVAEGYTNNQIAERLTISPKTVDTHRTHIMDKLNLHSRAELVKYAMRRGLLED